jgi:hypothetical protein
MGGFRSVAVSRVVFVSYRPWIPSNSEHSVIEYRGNDDDMPACPARDSAESLAGWALLGRQAALRLRLAACGGRPPRQGRESSRHRSR